LKTKVLALDMSTKTGYAVVSMDETGYELIESGTLPKESEPEGDYPVNYLEWSGKCIGHIIKLYEKFLPDELVIEETAKGSKNNMSQKIVEFVHYELALCLEKGGIMEDLPRTYYLTEEWRRICGCKMNDAEKKQNAEVRKQRKKGIKVCKDKDGKRIGIIGKKHVNVRRANEVYGLDLILKDEDRADALLLAHALYLTKYEKKDEK
jgi:Holliday junction resolvasome RuvABC endonuclease subunit